MTVCKNYINKFIIFFLYSFIISNPEVQTFSSSGSGKVFRHYVMDHELGHAYISIKNGITVHKISANYLQGSTIRNSTKDMFIDLEILAGGMAMELGYGESYLRLDQDDTNEMKKRMKNKGFKVGVDKERLILSQGKTLVSYKIDRNSDIFSSKYLSFDKLSKEEKKAFFHLLVIGVRKKYFEETFDKNFCEFLKQSLLNNNFSITLQDIKKFDLNINYITQEEVKKVEQKTILNANHQKNLENKNVKELVQQALNNDEKAIIELNCLMALNNFKIALTVEESARLKSLLEEHKQKNSEIYYLEKQDSNRWLNIFYILLLLVLVSFLCN